MSSPRILVAGAGGALGLEIVRRLRERGADVIATFRTPRIGLIEALEALGATPRQVHFDDAAALAQVISETDGAILTPILSVSKSAAPLLADGRRAVFFSSNNVDVDPENGTYAKLRRAEEEVLGAAPGALILRPTMIYGYPGDGNISRLMAAIRRWPIIPSPGGGRALQQPVYYRDLAAIAVETFFNGAVGDRRLAVSGPQPLTQRALYQAVAAALGRRPIIVPIPVGALAPFIELLAMLNLKTPLSAAQLRRADWDKTPRGEAVVRTETSFETGVSRLAAALDGREPRP